MAPTRTSSTTKKKDSAWNKYNDLLRTVELTLETVAIMGIEACACDSVDREITNCENIHPVTTISGIGLE